MKKVKIINYQLSNKQHSLVICFILNNKNFVIVLISYDMVIGSTCIRIALYDYI